MMNILARILSHGFAIAVVVILAVGYIYRGELFPGVELPAFLYPSTPAQTEAEAPVDDIDREQPAPEIASEPDPSDSGEPPAETTELEPATAPTAPADTGTGPEIASIPDSGDSEEPPAETTELEPATVPTAPVDAGTGPEITSEPDSGVSEEPPAETVAEEPVVAPSAPVEIPDDSVQRDRSISGDETPAELTMTGDVSEPQAAVEAADAMPAESMQPAVTDAETVPVPSAEDSGSAAQVVETSTGHTETARPYQLLAAAREAFWMHDYSEAEANYRGLIALEPGNPDGYGELGNMYFTQGSWEQAAEAYFNAGKNLVIAGRLQQAEMLVKVIRGLNGNQADELAELVAAAR